MPCDEPEPTWGGDDEAELHAKWIAGRELVEFPDMSARKNVTLGKRSGVMVIAAR